MTYFTGEFTITDRPPAYQAMVNAGFNFDSITEAIEDEFSRDSSVCLIAVPEQFGVTIEGEETGSAGLKLLQALAPWVADGGVVHGDSDGEEWRWIFHGGKIRIDTCIQVWPALPGEENTRADWAYTVAIDGTDMSYTDWSTIPADRKP